MRGSIWRKERFIAVGWVERFLGSTQSSITQVKPNHKIPLSRHTPILSVPGCVGFQAAPSTQPTPIFAQNGLSSLLPQQSFQRVDRSKIQATV
jgi:hypothetical protein